MPPRLYYQTVPGLGSNSPARQAVEAMGAQQSVPAADSTAILFLLHGGARSSQLDHYALPAGMVFHLLDTKQESPPLEPNGANVRTLWWSGTYWHFAPTNGYTDLPRSVSVCVEQWIDGLKLGETLASLRNDPRNTPAGLVDTLLGRRAQPLQLRTYALSPQAGVPREATESVHKSLGAQFQEDPNGQIRVHLLPYREDGGHESSIEQLAAQAGINLFVVLVPRTAELAAAASKLLRMPNAAVMPVADAQVAGEAALAALHRFHVRRFTHGQAPQERLALKHIQELTDLSSKLDIDVRKLIDSSE